MTSNQHGPYVRGDTRVTMGSTAGSYLATGCQSFKTLLSSDRSLQLEKYRLVTYPEKKDLMTRVLESMNKNVSTRIIKNYLSEYSPGLLELMETKLEPGILARMPYNLIIQ
jgi:hypothetical protein